MTRITQRFLLGIALTFVVGILNAQNIKPVNVNKIDRLIKAKDFEIEKLERHPIAEQAMQRGVQPGTFQNVTYTYKDNVVVKPTNTLLNTVNNLDDKGVITRSRYNLSNDSIYIGEDSKLVMQSADLTNDEIMVYRPTIEEVFKDFNLPLQTVPLTLANTTYTLPGTEVTDNNDGTEYSMTMDFKDKEYHFDKNFKPIKNEDVTVEVTPEITLKINGYIAYNKPSIEAKYGKNSGYRLIFHADEKAQIKINSDIKVSTEVQIPVWEWKIPSNDIASGKVGVFIVIGVSGEIKLIVDINQELNVHSGVHGGTKWYFPTSVHTVNEFNSRCDINRDSLYIKELTLKGGIEAVANIKAKGYDILRLRARGTLDFKAEFQDDTMKNYDLELGLSVKLDGKVKKIDKNFTIVDKYFKIWEKSERNFGNYTMIVKNADAYHDRVHGEIFRTIEGTAYNGSLTLTVLHKNGSKTNYEGQTNENGIFAMTDIPLVKGDQVSVIIPESENESDYIDAEIPFKKIALKYADYFTNEVEGYISDYINTFPKDALVSNEQATNNPVSNDNPAVNAQVTNKINPIKKFEPSLVSQLNKIDFNDLVIYDGPVNVIVQPLPTVNLIGNPLELNNDQPKAKQRIKKLNPNIKKTSKVNPVAKTQLPKNIGQEKLAIPYEVKNLPFGVFKVSNVDIKPQDKVKVQIKIDGFTVESDWIMSDGIIITPSEDVNYSGLDEQKLSADNSKISVSAMRSDTKPQGVIRVMKGADFKHNSTDQQLLGQTQEDNELFPEARHSVIFYDETLTLSNASKGDLIAQTGPWEVNNPYYGVTAIHGLEPYDAHYFEYNGMTYEGRWIGYKFYQEHCRTCDYNKFMENLETAKEYLSNPKIDNGQIETPIPDLDDLNMGQIRMMNKQINVQNNINMH